MGSGVSTTSHKTSFEFGPPTKRVADYAIDCIPIFTLCKVKQVFAHLYM